MAIRVKGQVVIYDDEVVRVSANTTANRPGSPQTGMLRFNTTTTKFEGYNGTTWGNIGGGGTITDDTTTNANRYILLTPSTTGQAETLNVSSTKLYYNPSTGTSFSTVFQSLSDISEKENIVTIYNATEIVNNLHGVEFNWKDGGSKSSGVIAQEVETILPHLVTVGNENKKTVNYDGIIAYLIESIKELNERIKELENR